MEITQFVVNTVAFNTFDVWSLQGDAPNTAHTH